MTSSDRFPVPVRSAVKSNLTDWCFQNLSKRALNALTVQASTCTTNLIHACLSLPSRSIHVKMTTIQALYAVNLLINLLSKRKI